MLRRRQVAAFLVLTALLVASGLACKGGSGNGASPAANGQEPGAVATGSGGQSVSSGAPAPSAQQASERIRLQTNTSTKYYMVRGLTSESIFNFIERNGPTDDAGARGSGLTAAKWSYVWKGDSGRSGCSIVSLTVSVDLVVTLPKHEQQAQLTPGVTRNWDRFAADVGKHEQSHVDIYLKGADSMKQAMLDIPSQPSCDALEKKIDGVWAEQQKLIDGQQEKFHHDEETRINALRRPLQNQIDTNRGRLASLNTQIQQLDGQVASLRNDIKGVETQIEPIKSEMERIEATFGQNMAPPVFARYESLRQQYNTLISRYNSLVDQHNSALDRRNKTAGDYDALVGATNDLVEQFNWTR